MTHKFSFDTIKDFDEHINSSIPNYELIHKCIDGLIQYAIKQNSIIYDIGCSTGLLLQRIHKTYTHAPHNLNLTLTGYDRSSNLLPTHNTSNQIPINYINEDVTNPNINFNNSDIILSIFTLCFIETKHRLNLLQKIYDGLNDNCIFIITEKTYSTDAKIQDMFTFLFYDYKKNNFSSEEILSKENELRRIQYPLTEEDNLAMLRKVGFKKIDTFWKCYNFQGWICIK